NLQHIRMQLKTSHKGSVPRQPEIAAQSDYLISSSVSKQSFSDNHDPAGKSLAARRPNTI
ncbi:MAG TPA: hypothetical protein PKD05_05505, partial [Candidatus Melainabacteria bacterium]|nr:hypothetical protein [Candidatus Melainabacteria bacterium]